VEACVKAHRREVRAMSTSDWIAYVVMGVSLWVFYLLSLHRRRHLGARTHVLLIFSLLIGLFGGALVNIFFVGSRLDIFITDADKRLFTRLGPDGTRVYFAVLAVCIGYGAYSFKRFSPTLYGICEVLFATIGAFYASKGISPEALFSSTGWWALGGCAYIVQRGLNNIAEGMKPVPMGQI
jgi:hypothetical protein